MKEFHLFREGSVHHTSRVTVHGHNRPYALAIHNLPGNPWPVSPDGHAWGYAGAGSTQLAMDILWDVFAWPPHPQFYQAFRAKFLERLAAEHAVITEAVVREWADEFDGLRQIIPIGERIT